MQRGGFAQFNVVGAYPTLERARKAIDALQFGGVESDRISLQGGPARAAEEQASSRPNTTDRDVPMIRRLVARAAFFGAIGAGVFAILGLILWAIGWDIDRITGSPAVMILSWTAFGLIAGALWGAYSSISQGQAWELTFEQDADNAPGEVLVAVHSDNPDDITRAEKILRDKHAVRVSQFDREGHLTT
jgi:hypothetical protein